MRIILASKSPRRRELLSALYRDFEIISEETDETLPAGVHPREGVAILAVRKGAAVREKVGDEVVYFCTVIPVQIKCNVWVVSRFGNFEIQKRFSFCFIEGVFRKLTGTLHSVLHLLGIEYHVSAFILLPITFCVLASSNAFNTSLLTFIRSEYLVKSSLLD